MSKLRRVLAITVTIAMIMIALNGIVASAGSIIITPPATPDDISLYDEATYAAYKIFDLSYSATPQEAYYYTLRPEYEDFEDEFMTAHPTYFAPTMPEITDLKSYIESLTESDNSGAIKAGCEEAMYELARELWTWSGLHNPTGKIAGTLFDGEVTFIAPTAGYYVVAGKIKRFGNEAWSFAILRTLKTDGDTVTAAIKGDAPTIKKEVAVGGSSDWHDGADVSSTESISFRIVSTVPDTTGYTSYTYIIQDKLSKGLTFIDDPVYVFAINPNDPLDGIELIEDGAADYGYTLSGPTPIVGGVFDGYNAINFTINSKTILALDPRYEIVITYSVKLNDDAVIGHKGNPNFANLKYRNNPFKEEYGETPDDDAWVYTYGLKVFKYTGDTDPTKGLPLPGVKFYMTWDIAKNGNFDFLLKFHEVDGVYKPFSCSDIGAVVDIFKEHPDWFIVPDTILETDADGMIYIEGLDAGTYKLVEYERLPGYNPIDDIIFKIYNSNIFGDVGGGTFGEIEDEETWLDENYGEDGAGDYKVGWTSKGVFVFNKDQLDVYNGTGFKFPITGGIGRTIFIISGLALMLGAIITLGVRRKKTEADPDIQ